MRDFEKISFEQFKKDVADDRDLYDSIIIPQRDSAASVGYDLPLLSDLELAPGETATFRIETRSSNTAPWTQLQEAVIGNGRLTSGALQLTTPSSSAIHRAILACD